MSDEFRENKLRYDIIWLDNESKVLRREIKSLNAEFYGELSHGWMYRLWHFRKIREIDQKFFDRCDKHAELTKQTLKKALELQYILTNKQN